LDRRLVSRGVCVFRWPKARHKGEISHHHRLALSLRNIGLFLTCSDLAGQQSPTLANLVLHVTQNSPNDLSDAFHQERPSESRLSIEPRPSRVLKKLPADH